VYGEIPSSDLNDNLGPLPIHAGKSRPKTPRNFSIPRQPFLAS
jgi:hypothetical protein